MKKGIILLAALMLGLGIKAQHEVGIGIGTAHLFGDFGGGPGNGTIFIKDLDLRSTRPSVSVFYRYNFAKVLAVRAQLLYGHLYSNDKFSENQFRFARQLNSSSSIIDASIQAEIHFVPLRFCSGTARFSPYVAAGVGISNVQTQLASNTVEGIPATETQYIDASIAPVVLNVPLALGVKYKTKKNIVLGLETSYRIAFTDKIDSYVRQQNDHLLFIQAQLSYVFCKNRKGGKISKDVSCPAFKY